MLGWDLSSITTKKYPFCYLHWKHPTVVWCHYFWNKSCWWWWLEQTVQKIRNYDIFYKSKVGNWPNRLPNTQRWGGIGTPKHTKKKHPTSGGIIWKTRVNCAMPIGISNAFGPIPFYFQLLLGIQLASAMIPSSTLKAWKSIPSSVPIISHLLSGNHSTHLCWICWCSGAVRLVHLYQVDCGMRHVMADQPTPPNVLPTPRNKGLIDGLI